MSKVISRDGTLIDFEEVGTGPALLLIDGAFGNRAAGPLPELAALLAKDFTVINYDRRGRNKSGDATAHAIKPDLWDVSDLWKEAGGAAQLYKYYGSEEAKPYTIECEIEDIAALINHVGGAAYLYGYSSGALLALLAAAALGGVIGLALYDPALMLAWREKAVVPAYLKCLEELMAVDRYGDMVECFQKEILGLSSGDIDMLRHSDERPALETVAPTLIYDAQIIDAFSSSSELARTLAAIKTPTIIMSGGKSPAYLQDAAAVVAAGVPGAKLQSLPGQNNEVEVEVIAPRLIEFFQGHATSEDIVTVRKSFALDVLQQGDLANCYKVGSIITELQIREAIPFLIEMLGKAPAVLKKDMVIPVLRDLRAVDAVPMLRELLAASEEMGVVFAAAGALEVLVGPPIGSELIAALERITISSNRDGSGKDAYTGYDTVRWGLVRSLLNLKVVGALPLIFPLLGDRSPGLRLLAETAVYELGQPETLAALAEWEQRLVTQPEENVRISRLQKLRQRLKKNLKAKGFIV